MQGGVGAGWGGWVVREGVPLFDGSLLTGSLNFHLYTNPINRYSRICVCY